MMAIINLPNQEEIIYDLNVTIFNVLPSHIAKIRWNELNEMIQEGLDEESAYNYMNGYCRDENEWCE